MVSVIGVAIIPSIGQCQERTDDLTVGLRSEGIHVYVVNNLPGLPRVTERSWRHTYMQRQWGIYRTWNFGLRVGALCHLPVLVLNDDIVLESGAAWLMCRELTTNGYGLLGFDYRPRPRRGGFIRDVSGTYKDGGIGGFAFGVNPDWCRLRVDRRFRWWGGDDDLVNQAALVARVGILAEAGVSHPEPSYTAHRRPDLLPEGWAENDRALLIEKWGRAW